MSKSSILTTQFQPTPKEETTTTNNPILKPQRKPPKMKYVHQGNLTGQGPTLKAANADLKQKIDNALNGSYSPVILQFDGHLAFIYRDLSSWCYTVVHPNIKLESGPNFFGQNFGCTVCADQKDAIRSAKRHLIQISPNLLNFYDNADLPPWLDHEDDKNEMLRYARWQRAAQHAKTIGHSDPWQYANEHEDEFAQRPK